MSYKDPDYFFKILLVGDSGVGKSSLMQRFAEDFFPTSFFPTIGVDFKFKNIELNNLLIKLQIWDTAGQERFRAITTSYYRGAHGVALVYDISNKKSFEDIENWLEDVRKYAKENIVTLLIGNKSDLINQREVSFDDGKKLAGLHGMIFIETSAKEMTNVNKAMINLTELIARQVCNVNPAIKSKLKITDFEGESVNGNKGNCLC